MMMNRDMMTSRKRDFKMKYETQLEAWQNSQKKL